MIEIDEEIVKLSLTEYYKITDPPKLTQINAIIGLYTRIGLVSFQSKLFKIYGTPFKLFNEDNSGNRKYFELYWHDFPNKQVKRFKIYLKRYKSGSFISVPRKDILIALHICWMNQDIQKRFIYSGQIWEKVVIFNDGRTEVEFEFSCKTFDYFYNSVLKPLKAYRRDCDKLKKLNFHMIYF